MDIQHNSSAEETLSFAAGAVIFREGDAGAVLYIINQGTVEISMQGQALEQLGSGDIFGEMALIENMPRSATATAVTDCLLDPVDREHFLLLIKRTPLFALQVMRVLAGRLRRTNEQRFA